MAEVHAAPEGKVAVPVKEFPLVSFPCEVRFATNGIAVGGVFRVRDADTLIRKLGGVGMNAELTGFFGDAVEFSLVVPQAPAYARDLVLKIDNEIVGEAKSQPSEKIGAPSQPQRIWIELPTQLYNGGVLALEDHATGQIVFEEPVGSVKMVGAIARSQRNLLNRIDDLEREQRRLIEQANVNSIQARERLLMERIDLFYSLIQDRLNRELCAVVADVGHIDANPDGDGNIAEHDSDEEWHNDLHFTAESIEGIGFYDLEGEIDSYWRWFGPRTTLVLREVPVGARSVRLAFSNLPNGIQETGVSATVNAKEVDIILEREEKEGNIIVILDPENRTKIDKRSTLIVNLKFEYSFMQSDNDRRVLSAAFSDGTVSV
ncbi:hypothetical protein D3874_04910 [Oleomonas cavernae]|uniref:Uncharacterized protein n=2 Tax=Oleomonas cavernae TaxID=2320859 RepID=A0A418W8X9_9PROT|nr:hypothetical protein D3874_04910 [Oleomonas cavernae]